MKLAKALGGDERHYFSQELSYQVKFVNYEIYTGAVKRRGVTSWTVYIVAIYLLMCVYVRVSYWDVSVYALSVCL